MSDYAALASRIRTSLLDIEKSFDRSLELSRKARTMVIGAELPRIYTAFIPASSISWRISHGPLKTVCPPVQAGMLTC